LVVKNPTHRLTKNHYQIHLHNDESGNSFPRTAQFCKIYVFNEGIYGRRNIILGMYSRRNSGRVQAILQEILHPFY
jgi:hypothetical protein